MMFYQAVGNDDKKHFQRQNLNRDFLRAYEFTSIEPISLLLLASVCVY